MNLEKANELWYKSQPIRGILFAYNDYVRIISGKYSGEYASVISLISIEPIAYLIELDSGEGDVIIVESELVKSE